MAIQEIYHVVATSLPVNSTLASDLPGGRLVMMGLDGKVRLPEVVGNRILGIAGDTRATTFSSTTRNPESAALVIGAQGASTKYTVQNVAFGANDTLGSGKITVYHSGGEFYTDQYTLQNDSGAVQYINPGYPLYSTVNGTPSGTTGGLFTSDSSSSKVLVAIALEAPGALQSGVPGTDINGSISWGTFLHVLMRV